MLDQKFLNHYFKDVWHSHITKYRFTGPALVKKVFSHEHVIDVGCGDNYFRGKVRNLIGIDPANPNADVISTIEDFKSNKLFDVAFCLGSINFGSQLDVEQQIRSLIALLKPQARIYWRCNIGKHDHGNLECQQIAFFPWSIDKHFMLSKKFGFDLMEIEWEPCGRMYAVWTRP